MRALAALLAAVALAAAPPAAATTFVDAVLAEVEGRTVTASDIGVARALGGFGLTPSAAPIDAAQVERMVAAGLVVLEAQRLDIAPTAAETEAAWRAAQQRLGAGTLERWLERAGVGEAWARRVVEEDLRWRRYVDLRFRAFAFVTEDDLTAALGPGPHPPAAREAARVRLAEAETTRRLEEWLAETAERVRITRHLPPGRQVPCPVPMPGG